MAEDGFTTIRVRNSTLRRIREMAVNGYRSVGAQIDLLVDEKLMQVVSVSTLPHPDDAEPVPLVLVAPLVSPTEGE